MQGSRPRPGAAESGELSSAQMHVVVNHLHFRDPVGDVTGASAQDAVLRVVEAGGLAARVIRVDDTHLILLLEFSARG
jgi:hypothetical protein